MELQPVLLVFRENVRLNDVIFLRAGFIKGVVDSVYRIGFTAAFRGNTNTATQANTCKTKFFFVNALQG